MGKPQGNVRAQSGLLARRNTPYSDRLDLGYANWCLCPEYSCSRRRSSLLHIILERRPIPGVKYTGALTDTSIQASIAHGMGLDSSENPTIRIARNVETVAI